MVAEENLVNQKCDSSRILITGAAGFVGHHLVHEFEEHGYSVFTTDVVEGVSDLPNYHKADLCNRDELCKLVQEVKPTACVHLGAISFVPDGDKNPAFLLSVNVAGSVNIAEAIRQNAPSCRLLFVSSSQVYGPIASMEAACSPITEEAPLLPLSIYAISKVAAERALLAYGSAYGMEVMIARPANHTGPGQSPRFVTVAFAKQILEFKQGKIEKLCTGNLESIRDFTDVRDVAKAYRLIIEKGVAGNAYNISTDYRVTMGELLALLQELCGTNAPVETSPELYRPTDASQKLDCTKLCKHTGWQCDYDLKQTLRDIISAL